MPSTIRLSRPLAYRFLAFLPPSFILITGFLVGQVYATKYDLGTWKPYMRLVVRGLKLLAIFTALNVAHCVIAERGALEGMWEFAGPIERDLSVGETAGRFEVLLPISYFLLLAPVLLWFRSRATGGIAACAVIVFLGLLRP